MYSTSVAVLRIIDSQTYSGRVEIVHLLPLPLNSAKYLMTSAAEILSGRNPSDKQSQSCTRRDPFVFVMHLNYHYSPDA